MQRFFRRKRDRVQQDIELPPFLFDSLEYLLRLPFHIDIQRHENRCFQFPGERLDKPFRAIVQVGHSQLGAQGPKCFGTPPGNRLIVGDPYDQAFSSLKGNLRLRKQWDGHDALARVEVVGCIFQSREKMCSARTVPEIEHRVPAIAAGLGQELGPRSETLIGNAEAMEAGTKQAASKISNWSVSQ